MSRINVIGAGLAGSEAAWQLANRGYEVFIYEMKPKKFSPAHRLNGFCELVCSNSLKSSSLTNACGLLKEEMRRLNSITMLTADEAKIPAGGALAVDRNIYSEKVTKKILDLPNVHLITDEVTDLDNLEGITIVATGPLTSEGLQKYLKTKMDDFLYFYDAVSPVVSADSINYDKAFFADRYGKGEADYLNCPMTSKEYFDFYNELVKAECVILRNFEKREIFDSCMPVEIMAKRGVETLCFGPLKPVGLGDEDKKYKAIVQLRYENKEKTMFNLVGFQTNLKFSEQKRVFSMIPGLENAEFLRYGVMHRNTFINSPKLLNEGVQLKTNEKIFFAGQITGVEGYVESAMSGLIAAIQIDRMLKGEEFIKFSPKTAIGGLMNFLTTENSKFQPMNANFGIIDTKGLQRIRNKRERYEIVSKIALEETDLLVNELGE